MPKRKRRSPGRNGQTQPPQRQQNGASAGSSASTSTTASTSSSTSTSRTSSGVPELVLSRAATSPEQLAAVNSARREGASAQEQLEAVQRAANQRRPPRNLTILGFSCNLAAFTAIVAVLAIILGLYFQNRGLRSIIESRSIIDPLVARMPDMSLAQRLYDGMPGLGPDLSALGLAHLGQTIGDSLSSLSLPSHINVRELLPSLELPRPGLKLRQSGLRPHHPVVIIPGFVTSGLELWQTLPCAAHQRRGRVWGSWAMTRSFLMNKQCWLDHLRLDDVTGLDPEGVKVRASQGLEAVDYFVAGYHVWARMIEALADLGYDTNDLVTEPYDWRLALPNLERRDGYFSRLRARIEVLSKTRGEKVCVVAHSWGDTVFRQFMAWVSADNPLWVEQHVAVYANIAGPTLGVPKAVSSFLSGETRDTVEMGYVTALLANAHFTRAERTRLFRSWGGGIGMLPTGGNAVWGNATSAPDDPQHLRERGLSFGPMLTTWETGDEQAEQAARHHASLLDTFIWGGNPAVATERPDVRRLDVEAATQVLLEEAGPTFAANARRWSGLSENATAGRGCGASTLGDSFHFSPLDCPLPKAPSLRMFCMYGVGIATERAYHYQHLRSAKAASAAKREDTQDPTELDVAYRLYADVSQQSLGVDSGVLLSDGDGTVPLLSLGALCRNQWHQRELNPAGISVVTREYRHEHDPSPKRPPASMSLGLLQHLQNLRNFMRRGGPRSTDHVDILANEDVLRDVLLMAAGSAEALGDEIHTDIDAIAARVQTAHS